MQSSLLKKNNIQKSLAVVLLAVTCLLGWYLYARSGVGLYEYDPATDKDEIVALYDKDRYWLTDSAESTIEFMLKYKSYDANPANKGKLHFKILKEHNKFAGFTAYYMQQPGVGKVLFLAVKHEFRGKKYGTILMAHAIEQLKKLGAHDVILVTRTTNYPAQRVYESMGFKETYREESMGYVFYNYHIFA